MVKSICAIAALLLTVTVIGGTPMLDIPVPSNQTIIIFSATGGASAEGGNVRQNISFTAQTAITITGGLENDWVRITPSGSTFIAVAKFHEASGSATFTATVSTAGDSEKNLAAASVEFTFRVLVLGVDFPHLTTSFFEFAVGDEVDVSLPLFFASTQAQLNIAKVSTAITSQTYGEVEDYTDTDHGSITRQRWVGASSGISLSPVLDEEEYVRGATLTGTATRPGIYYRAFEISSYDDGETTPFPGATGYGLVIINIYDDRDAPKLIVPYAHTADADFVRVIRHALTDPIADRLVGAFAKSGELWQRQVSEAISETVNDVWEYQIAYDAETLTWTLSGRTYLSDETVPDYTALATATGRFGTVPPNTGWTGSVLYAGDSGKYVPGYGFFDYKGERTVTTGEGEEEVTFASDVYEQQPVVAAQYEIGRASCRERV